MLVALAFHDMLICKWYVSSTSISFSGNMVYYKFDTCTVISIYSGLLVSDQVCYITFCYNVLKSLVKKVLLDIRNLLIVCFHVAPVFLNIVTPANLAENLN